MNDNNQKTQAVSVGSSAPLTASGEGPRTEVEPPLILIVDDEKTMRMLLRKAMQKEHYRVAEAVNGEQGIELYKDLQPKVVLLDAMMPVQDGFTCCEKMMALPGSDRTPILMITTLDDRGSVDRAYAAGATDYVTKPIHWPVLSQRVRRLIRQVELFEELEVAKEKLEAANHELQRLASLDGLTQVANRRCFDQVLEREWQRGIRDSWGLANIQSISLILCDVDHFKLYNDTYGHPAGDACLQQVAQVLQQAAKRPADLVARYGGEEFAVILPNTDGPGACHVAELIRCQLLDCKLSHSTSSVSQYVTLSLGVATIAPTPHTSPATLIAAADAALYQAKESGRDRVIYNGSLMTSTAEDLQPT